MTRLSLSTTAPTPALSSAIWIMSLYYFLRFHESAGTSDCFQSPHFDMGVGGDAVPPQLRMVQIL